MAKKEAGISEEKVIKTRELCDLDKLTLWCSNEYKHKEIFKKYDGTEFYFPSHLFRKLSRYVYDLVYKNKDFNMYFSGGEGTGKTTHATQWGQVFYYILTECNIINEELGTYYVYDEKTCMAHDLDDYNSMSDKYSDNLFRIIICDETGDLKAEDRFNKNNKDYRKKMRKDRKSLHIKLFNYPNVFELSKDAIIDRSNGFVLCKENEGLDKFGGSIPNVADVVFIPRGDYTFSWDDNHKFGELVSKEELKAEIEEILKHKYFKTIDKKYVYLTYKRDNVFCFNAQDYIKRAKEKAKIEGEIAQFRLTEHQMRVLFKYVTAKKIFGKGRKSVIPQGVSKEVANQIDLENKALQTINNIRKEMSDYFKALGIDPKLIKEDEYHSIQTDFVEDTLEEQEI